MHFVGAQSRSGVGVRIIFTSPQGETTIFSYILEIDITNIVVEYEALLLSLELERDMEINVLVVVGDFDLVVKQVKNAFSIKNNRLKQYLHVVWNIINLFDSFNIMLSQNIKIPMFIP